MSDGTHLKYVADLKPKEHINGFFRISFIQVKETRGGKPYLDLKLKDKTGEIQAKVWDYGDGEDLTRGDFVAVAGQVELYQETPQLVLKKIRRVTEEDRAYGFKEDHFEERTAYDVEAMWSEIVGIGETFSAPIKDLVLELLSGHREAFCRAPASQYHHHPFVGGLLEHTLSVTRTCLYLAEKYPVRRDLLLAGAILHDIGKLKELSFEGETHYTTSGRLIGHIIQGRDMVREKAKEIPDFPEEDLVELEHLVLSHQGRPEWNSPRVPQTLEALALHYADDLDAKVQIFERAVERDRGAEPFTPRHRSLDRQIYKTPLLRELERREEAPSGEK